MSNVYNMKASIQRMAKVVLFTCMGECPLYISKKNIILEFLI